MKTIFNYISRTLFGLVFIFSGFVKAVDPMGTAYKIEEYLNAFGFSALLNCDYLTLGLSILLCTAEFMIGISVLFHIYNKANRYLALVFMAFFTVTTFIDALTNNVTDCGCFGDAITLTNWQTFIKNIVLDIVLVVIFLTDIKPINTNNHKIKILVITLFLLSIIGFCVRNVLYEPCIDFRPWKVGNKMAPLPQEQKPAICFAIYKNNSTGKEQTFAMDELTKEYEKDPQFADHWTFVDSKIKNPNEIKAEGFSLLAFESQEDESLKILSDTTKDLYMIAIVNLDKATPKAMQRVKRFAKQKAKDNNVIFITSSLPEKWIGFMTKYSLEDYMFYSCDDKAIEAMIRSNPGIVHISKTIVKHKYAWRDLK